MRVSLGKTSVKTLPISNIEQKYLERAKKKGLKGKALKADALARQADAQNQAMSRSLVVVPKLNARQLRPTAPKREAANQRPFLANPFAPRVSSIDTLMRHPKYHDYYIRNFSRQLPIPYTASDGVPVKTLPTTATVSWTYTLPVGSQLVVAPTPDHPKNLPFLFWTNDLEHTAGNVMDGGWFGGIGPQQLMGPQPEGSNVDHRAVQFKGGALEISAAVAYNATCTVGYLDPYTTLGYGKSTGYMQLEDPGGTLSGPYSAAHRDWPYWATVADPLSFDGWMNRSVQNMLVGSSGASSITARQTIRPIGHSFAPCVSASVSDSSYPQLGFINPYTGLDAVAQVGQGMFLIDNSKGSEPVSVALKMDMHYRVRVDNQAPAVYMMADDRTTPKHSIEVTPVITAAPSRAAAVQSHAAANKVSPVNKPAAQAPIPQQAAGVDSKSTNGVVDAIGKIPLVGPGAKRSINGLEKAFTEGNDPSALIDGLADFAMGALDVVGGIFDIFG